MRHLLVACAAVACAAVLAACSSGDSDTSTSSTTASSAPATTSTAPAVAAIPSPNSAQTPDLLAGLRALRSLPSEVYNDGDKLIRWSSRTCQRIKEGAETAALTRYVLGEFSYGDHGISASDASRVIQIVRSSFCN